jgi:hypothetical protein
MFRFIHSADWQLGASFVQFSHQADALRDFRLQTIRRALEDALAPALQVIILTCHADCYRGVGTAVVIVPQAGAN